MQLDLGVVALGGVDEAGEGLLEGRVLLLALAVGGERGLAVVQEALADGVGGDVVAGEQVDGGGRGPAGALVQQHLGEQVGREGGRVDRVGRVLAREEAGPARRLEPPRAEVEGLAEGRERGRRQAIRFEAREELGGFWR